MSSSDRLYVVPNIAPYPQARPEPREWWERALRFVQSVSILTWANEVVKAYEFELGPLSPRAAKNIQRQAMQAALYADGRYIGDWSTETALRRTGRGPSE